MAGIKDPFRQTNEKLVGYSQMNINGLYVQVFLYEVDSCCSHTLLMRLLTPEESNSKGWEKTDIWLSKHPDQEDAN